MTPTNNQGPKSNERSGVGLGGSLGARQGPGILSESRQTTFGLPLSTFAFGKSWSCRGSQGEIVGDRPHSDVAALRARFALSRQAANFIEQRLQAACLCPRRLLVFSTSPDQQHGNNRGCRVPSGIVSFTVPVFRAAGWGCR